MKFLIALVGATFVAGANDIISVSRKMWIERPGSDEALGNINDLNVQFTALITPLLRDVHGEEHFSLETSSVSMNDEVDSEWDKESFKTVKVSIEFSDMPPELTRRVWNNMWHIENKIEYFLSAKDGLNGIPLSRHRTNIWEATSYQNDGVPTPVLFQKFIADKYPEWVSEETHFVTKPCLAFLEINYLHEERRDEVYKRICIISVALLLVLILIVFVIFLFVRRRCSNRAVSASE